MKIPNLGLNVFLSRVYQLQYCMLHACNTFTTPTPSILVALGNHEQICKFLASWLIVNPHLPMIKGFASFFYGCPATEESVILIFHIFHSIIYINIFSESNVTASRLPAGLVHIQNSILYILHQCPHPTSLNKQKITSG